MRAAAEWVGPLLYFGSVLAAGFWRHPALLVTAGLGLLFTVAYAVCKPPR